MHCLSDLVSPETGQFMQENFTDHFNELLCFKKEEITVIVEYLKKIGIKNIDKVFTNYVNVILLPSTKVVDTFSKYRILELVDIINGDMDILEEVLFP